jgi:hypothetical protein
MTSNDEFDGVSLGDLARTNSVDYPEMLYVVDVPDIKPKRKPKPKPAIDILLPKQQWLPVEGEWVYEVRAYDGIVIMRAENQLAPYIFATPVG